MQLRSYVVKHDFGFSPNPFHGYCTLAACTPNHQGLRLEEGDWLIGHATAKAGRGLIYAMEVSGVMDCDEYYRAPRLVAKRPRFDRAGSAWGPTADRKERPGDKQRALTPCPRSGPAPGIPSRAAPASAGGPAGRRRRSRPLRGRRPARKGARGR